MSSRKRPSRCGCPSVVLGGGRDRRGACLCGGGDEQGTFRGLQRAAGELEERELTALDIVDGPWKAWADGGKFAPGGVDWDGWFLGLDEEGEADGGRLGMLILRG